MWNQPSTSNQKISMSASSTLWHVLFTTGEYTELLYAYKASKFKNSTDVYDSEQH